MEKIDKIILKLFVNEYNNIDEIALKLNKNEYEISEILDKYLNILNSFNIDEVLIK